MRYIKLAKSDKMGVYQHLEDLAVASDAQVNADFAKYGAQPPLIRDLVHGAE